MTAHLSGLARLLTERYRLHDVGLTDLGIPVNDVVAVSAAEGDFALKVYHRNRTLAGGAVGGRPPHPSASARGSRGAADSRSEWLSRGVHRRGAAAGGRALRLGARGQAQSRIRDVCPLGEAAARIHRAADGFAVSRIGRRTTPRYWWTISCGG